MKRNCFCCEEIRILRRMESFFRLFMNMEIATNFEVYILGLHVVDL